MEFYLMKAAIAKIMDVNYVEEKDYQYSLTKKNFANFPETSVGYYTYNNQACMPDVVEHPTYMVSDAMKDLILLYDENIEWKYIVLIPNDQKNLSKTVGKYCVMEIPRIDCMHQTTKILPNGAVEQLFLDKTRIPENDVFMIDGIIENQVVVSLRFVESVLRRNMFGIAFERIEIL